MFVSVKLFTVIPSSTNGTEELASLISRLSHQRANKNWITNVFSHQQLHLNQFVMLFFNTNLETTELFFLERFLVNAP